MADERHGEREARAARNEALFRSVNEQIEKLGETFSVLTGERTFMIACECARPYCLEMIEITLDDYRDVREQPRRYMVRAGHVDPEVETAVAERERYVIVQKPVD